MKGEQKRYFQEFSYGLELVRHITPWGVYGINAKHCISSRCNLVYHHCERGCSLRLMIYTFGDEIHAKAWWHAIAFALDKKIRQVETCRIFWRRWRDSNSCILQSNSTINSNLVLCKIRRSVAKNSRWLLFFGRSRSNSFFKLSNNKKSKYLIVLAFFVAEVKGFEPLWAVNPNGFQDRLVMTASIHLRVMNLEEKYLLQSLPIDYTLI